MIFENKMNIKFKKYKIICQKIISKQHVDDISLLATNVFTMSNSLADSSIGRDVILLCYSSGDCILPLQSWIASSDL